ncbi:MAG: hypothetical protein HY565_03515 [Candidatus Kerfeldbacteria bacterium]|nr:hypothetical protein [Candidatus Kerfeldbacteria bacterium]
MTHPTTQPKLIQVTAYATIATVVLVVVLTILAELQPALKTWLQTSFTHHWIGKSTLAVITFVVTGLACWFVPFTHTETTAFRAVRLACWASALGVIAIVGFFCYEAFAA